jgi:hypothetical protein
LRHVVLQLKIVEGPTRHDTTRSDALSRADGHVRRDGPICLTLS